MPRTQNGTPTRRTLLSLVGAGIGGSLLGPAIATGHRTDSEYVIVQGDRCVPVRPLRGQEPVEAFYDYQLPEKYVTEANGASAGSGPTYSSAGTTALQRARTSIAFLYQGPETLSLVVVHGSAADDDGGSVTFRLSGLPENGAWVVKDDRYRNPDTGDLRSFDRWQVGGTDHRIDWTWGSAGTDGGAFAGLGDDFEVVVDPAFNAAAALHGEHYEGTVTDWEFLVGSDGEERIALRMDEPIRIVAAPCGSDTGGEDDGDDDGPGRGPGDRGEGRGPPDDDDGRGPGDRGDGRGPPDDDQGRGPGDRGRGRGPPDDEEGRGSGDRDRGEGRGNRGRGRGNRERGRGRGR